MTRIVMVIASRWGCQGQMARSRDVRKPIGERREESSHGSSVWDFICHAMNGCHRFVRCEVYNERSPVGGA